MSRQQQEMPSGARGTVAGEAGDERSTARAVRDMFSSIAHRYDLLNHLLSFNVDRLWWRRTARSFRHVMNMPEARVLDLCCGTGDLAFALLRQGSAATVLGADFSHPMLVRARQKASGRSLAVIEADALTLPLADASLRLVVSSFGFRNLANYDKGLREIERVLMPGGEAGILEFGEPKGMMGWLYGYYFRRVLPRVGTWISGVKGPYAYLPASVGRFPAPPEMMERMRAAGFEEVCWIPYTFGIAGLYRGRKPA